MADFGRCNDPSCNDSAVRLFHCAHHCNKMVCLHHLIEHDRLMEREKQQLENSQNELKQFSSIYSSLVDEDKLRLDYEHKLQEYKRFVFDVNYCLESNFTDSEQIRLMTDKLKKAIQEKQSQSTEFLTIVKVEPIEEISPSITNQPTENLKDELICIDFDRVKDLIIDTDYHRRKTLEINAAQIKLKSPMIIANHVGDYSINTKIRIQKIPGLCPLWIDGSYGMVQQYHSVRLCQKKFFNDLYMHLRTYHGLLVPIAKVLSRAIHSKIPVTKRLFSTTTPVVDPHHCFACPMNSECHNLYWLPAGCLKRHLMDVHHMNEMVAEKTTNDIKLSNRNKSNLKIKNKAVKVIKELELASCDDKIHLKLKRRTLQ